MNTEEKICYSPIPAIQSFVENSGQNPSQMVTIANDLLRTQMNLSRIIMYSEVDFADIEEPFVGYIRGAMSLISNIYDVFEKIETSRKKYIKATQELE